MIAERTFSNAGYRFGFNGKENDDEVKGAGNSLDFGARIYDARLGRWFTVDPLAGTYPSCTPFSFAINTPINAIDPDGNVVIFINGMHNGFQGGKSSYWGGFDNKVMDKIGDHNAVYRDGSLGGALNTASILFAGLPISLLTNLNPFIRVEFGKMQAKQDASEIISHLKRDPNDRTKIIESIKLVSHSMGVAYDRGYAEGLNEAFIEYNSQLPDDSKLKGFKIEADYNFASFQGCYLPKSPFVDKTFYASGKKDGIANGKGIIGGMMQLLSPNSDIPGGIPMSTPDDACHDIIDYSVKDVETSNSNGNTIEEGLWKDE